MRRTLAVLAAAGSLALGGAVVVAGPAAAAPSDRSVHACESVSEHPGLHLGQKKNGNERRNLGGNCPAPEPALP